MKKRIISVLCIFLFIGVMSILLVLNNKYVINIYDIDKVDTWQEAYCNCLDEYKVDRYLADIWSVEASEVTTRIMLKDLDADTIPELWVVDVMSAPEVTDQISYDLDVFSFVDGKAERVGGFKGTEIRYAIEEGWIWCNCIQKMGVNQSSWNCFCHYANGTLVKDIILSYDDFGAGEYEIEGCSVTQEEYDEQMEIYTQGDYRTIDAEDGVTLNKVFVGISLNKAIEQISGNVAVQFASKMCDTVKCLVLQADETIEFAIEKLQ